MLGSNASSYSYWNILHIRIFNIVYKDEVKKTKKNQMSINVIKTLQYNKGVGNDNNSLIDILPVNF